MAETKIINPVETLQAFMHRKTVQDASMAQEAQRLVNVFRHLDVFGEAFIEPYNQQLLSAPQEVIMVLPTIVGGSLVRQYAEYLNRQMGITTETNDEVEVQQGGDGYLPEPENDIPLSMPMTLSEASGASAAVPVTTGLSTEKTIEVIDQIVTAQGQMFTDALEKIAVQTNEAAARQTAEITRVLADTQRSYYAVIEDKPLTAAPQAEQAETTSFPIQPESQALEQLQVAVSPKIPEPDELADMEPYEITSVLDDIVPEKTSVPEVNPFESDDDVEILSEVELSEE